jgi:hypothetical protein
MLETNTIAKVADRYRHRGYDVTVSPTGTAVPQFLGDFEPDLIATKGDESVVVRVTTRRQLVSDPRVAFAAEELSAKSGWRLDVVVEGEDAPWADRVTESAEPTLIQIGAMIQSARRLIGLGETDAACLIGWAAIEAAMRAIAANNAVPLERKTPALILKQLYAVGLLSREEYDSLEEAMGVRNAVAHGLKPSELNSDAARMVINSADRLLASLSRTAA